MKRYISYALAVLRGFFFTAMHVMKSSFRVGKGLLLFGNACIYARGNSNVRIGAQVKVGKSSVLSALNGGKITVEDNVSIGENCKIICHEEIRIGKGTLLAPNVSVYDHDHIFDRENGVNRKRFKTKSIVIGENCWIGTNVVILRGTHIGNNCVVGAGSVIKGDYSDGSVIIQKRITEIYEVK